MMSGIVLRLLALASTASAATLSIGAECFQKGECRKSIFVGSASTPDEFACLELCKSEARCNWFTFFQNTNYCQLFENCAEIGSDACSDCVTGEKSCTIPEPVCFVQGECQGVLLGTEASLSASACLQSCSSTEGCLWFTFNTGASRCLHFDSCTDLDESCTECISGERRCIEVSTSTSPAPTTPTPQGLTKLLVGLGYTNLDIMEVINLDDSGQICSLLPDYPIENAAATGQLINGSVPIICGGVTQTDELINHCECFALINGEWTEAPRLKTCRRFASSAVLTDEAGKEVMIVAGGSGGFGDENLDTIESFDGVSWRDDVYTRMPFVNWQFCIIEINSSTIMTVGGSDFGEYEATWKTNIFNIISNEWTQGPDLLGERWRHACGMMTQFNEETGETERILVVAGGSRYPKALSSVELLNLDSYLAGTSDGWESGPELPSPVQQATMFEYEDGVILVGGDSDLAGQSLYKLTPSSSDWEILPQKLNFPRRSHISFLIPDEFVNCYDSK